MPPAYDHQRRALAYAIAAGQLGRRGIYLNHVVGAGKTRTALGIAKTRKAMRVLVLAPLIALGVWQRETRKWWPGAAVISLRDGIAFPAYRPLVATINYDLLNDARVKAILKWKPQLLILDEAHLIKTPSAQRTRWATRLSKAIPFSVLLSGTPAHDPLDWWAQMRLVAPDDPFWQQRFGAYKEHVAIFGGPQRNWVTGFRPNVVDEVISKHILPYTHVVRREELKLPEPVESIIPFPLNIDELGAYRRLEKELIIQFPECDPLLVSHVFAQITKLRQIASGFVLSGFVSASGNPVLKQTLKLGNSKLQTLIDLVNQRGDHNIVISCHFTESLNTVLSMHTTKARVISGFTPGDERTKICDWFQAGGTGKIVILQEQAGGVAITLSHADTLIFYETPQSAITFEQVRGRIDRPGKPAFQEVLVLCAEQTLEEELYLGVKSKLDDVNLARRLLTGARSRH